MSADRKVKARIGRYELDVLIGEGGMGNVYRGLDTKTGRAVAVKVVNVPAEGEAADKLRMRFLREVRAISRIGHPNVVRVHDYGFSDDNTPYLVMELLVGTDLGKVLKASPSGLAIPYVADVLIEVCAAVRACHAESIVHRDLKPGNIFLAKTDEGPGWHAKVLDFGVAKAPFGDNLTSLGQIVGTLQYVSPEQVNGSAGRESDQYAIGVILYACLTKRLPFSGLKDVALLKSIARGDFPPPRSYRPEIPEALEAIVLRAMSTAQSDRFESVYELGQRLWPFASRLARHSWERFYTMVPGDSEMDGTTTEITGPKFPSLDAEALAPAAHDEGPTVIANYEGTTQVGVDEGALIGTLPTKVSDTSDDVSTLASATVRSSHLAGRSDAAGTSVSTGPGWLRRPSVIGILALILALAVVLALRLI